MWSLFQIILSLHLLLFHFPSSHSSQPLCRSDQSHALLQFKNSFTSKAEYVSGACNQTYAKTKTWKNDTNCCSWLGVTCDPISGQVIGLNLNCGGLKGKLQPNNTLFRLTRLKTLNLAFNDFSKSHLSSLFGEFVDLTHLYLSGSNFEGEIPSQISQLQNLIHLNLSFNKFSGPIPNVFGGLTKLKILDLSANNLEGPIPYSLLNSTQLSSLNFSYNKLEGPLPNKITGLSKLIAMRLNDNLFNGTIPAWCFSLPSLVGLDLSNNKLTGHINAISAYSLEFLLLCNNKLHGNIPKSISNLVNLTALCLSSNCWSGTVHFPFFSKFQKLEVLSLNHVGQIFIDFKSDVNYSFPRLKILELSSNNLTEFPKLLGKFSSLSCLEMSDNKFSGKVPNWLHEMDSLQILNLSRNLLTTSMDQFSWNYRLHVLDLSFNLLAGDISSSICNLSSLQILNLSHNRLMGTIPPCLVNLSCLQVLDLHMNKLHGSLPVFFPKNKLSDVNLSGNQLKGPVPTSLSKCTQLQVLNLGNNQIEDTFPHWLRKLPKLRVLVLRANKFHGAITSSNTKHIFPSLTILDISYNNFSGSLPLGYIKNLKAMKNPVESENSFQYVEFKYIIYGGKFQHYSLSYDSMFVTMKGVNLIITRIPTKLATLDLSANSFEGKIPYALGKLNALRGLNLSHNKLMGTIPSELGNLTNLESLDLSSNLLTGEIPMELINLKYLAVVNLSHNHLVGEIPQGKQFSTFSNDSYEGNRGLCGLPLSTKCDINCKQCSSASPTFWREEEKFGFDWKPVAIGYGCGIVFGVALGCFVLLMGKPLWLVRMVEVQQTKRMTRRARKRPRGRMNVLS